MARIEQVPAATSVTELPATVQTAAVVEAKLTGSPELAVALIVIPPENLPDVMRATGKILRALRLASNMVVRELGGALDQPPADQPAPPINTMKPAVAATGANIAQTAASADLS